MNTPIFIVGVLLSLIFLGMPISYSLGVTALATLVKLDYISFLGIMPQRMFGGLNSYAIMAMPFFMLAGEVMNRTGITNSLIKLAEMLVGWIRGGLAHVNILTSMLFAGLTGSAVSDTAALGSILIPSMVERGYSKGFSAAVTAASSIIGPIIPPSIIMVVYGSLMNVSIAGMFAAGIIPGILLGTSIMILSYFISIKKDYAEKRPIPSFKEVIIALKESIPALIMPLIILGGILGGIFTPTEAAAVAVLYAVIIGLFMRKLTVKDFWKIIQDTATSQGMILIILSCAAILAWVLASEQIPQSIANFMISITGNKLVMLFLINVLLLVFGMFMDITAALIILAPILGPIAIGLGVHPLHFGIIMTINLTMGLMTPPLGACLFVACGITKISLKVIAKDILPFIIVEVAILFLITYIPQLVMFIPNLLGYS